MNADALEDRVNKHLALVEHLIGMRATLAGNDVINVNKILNRVVYGNPRLNRVEEDKMTKRVQLLLHLHRTEGPHTCNAMPDITTTKRTFEKDFMRHKYLNS